MGRCHMSGVKLGHTGNPAKVTSIPRDFTSDVEKVVHPKRGTYSCLCCMIRENYVRHRCNAAKQSLFQGGMRQDWWGL